VIKDKLEDRTKSKDVSPLDTPKRNNEVQNI
jgi:hypothetical protein